MPEKPVYPPSLEPPGIELTGKIGNFSGKWLTASTLAVTARNEGRHDNPLRYLPGKTSPQIVGGLGKDSFNCDAGAAAWKILKNNHFHPTLRQENM
ncbi:MAG: hypothetical protein MI785_19270 [Kiloniellales bacterium]|nr:hypothetical protein [Kiloniellales bacterium]